MKKIFEKDRYSEAKNKNKKERKRNSATGVKPIINGTSVLPPISSYGHFAALHQLVLDGVVTDLNSGGPGTQSDKSGAPDVQMVPTGDEGADLPPDPAVHLDEQKNRPGILVLPQSDGVVRSDGDVGAVDERRPDVDVLVALVYRRDERRERDLLRTVGRVDVEPVIVDADLVVRVSGGDGDLEAGGEDIGGGGVEVEDGDVLEDEAGLGGLEDGPHDEDCDEEDEVED